MQKNQRKAVFVDCDGTLVDSIGRVNHNVMRWVDDQIRSGVEVFVWSARGSAYAAQTAKLVGLKGFTAIPKPTLLIDDKGWSWARHVPAYSRKLPAMSCAA